MHMALVVFFCDFVAVIWPRFEVIWAPKMAHVGVALAAFVALLAEYIPDEKG